MVTAGGTTVGAVGPFTVDAPWLAEVEAVTTHLSEVLGAPACVVRLVRVEDRLPTTVVHGDFHSGNWRSEHGGPPAVLDFADAHVGTPVLAGLRVTEFGDTAHTPAAHAAWVAAWRAACPGSDPARALVVGAPLAQLYFAVRYQEFLDGIEESERIYHEGDPASGVRTAPRCHAAARTGT